MAKAHSHSAVCSTHLVISSTLTCAKHAAVAGGTVLWQCAAITFGVILAALCSQTATEKSPFGQLCSIRTAPVCFETNMQLLLSTTRCWLHAADSTICVCFARHKTRKCSDCSTSTTVPSNCNYLLYALMPGQGHSAGLRLKGSFIAHLTASVTRFRFRDIKYY